MNNKNGTLQEIKTTYFGLSKIVRSLLISGILAVAYAIADMALIQPLMEEYSEITRSVEKAKAESKGFAASLLNLQGTAGIDPSLSNEKQMEVLTIKLEELENSINSTTRNFVEPEQMSEFLTKLLSKGKNLTLISMGNKEPDSIIIKTTKNITVEKNKTTTNPEKLEVTEEKTEVIAEDRVYKHSVILTFRGKYPDIAIYLHNLEQMHWGIFWQSLELEAETYPYSTVSIELYTLSLKKDWLTL